MRSNASWSGISGLAATIAWAINGIVSMTACPSPVVSIADIAPAEQRLPLGADEMLDMRDRDGARLLVHRQKAHRHGVAAGRRQFEAALAGPMAQQRVRHLDHAAGAVAHQRVGADRAAMVEIDEDLQPAADDIVRFSALDVRDKADAARIVLVARIVEALSRVADAILNALSRCGRSRVGVGRSLPSANAGRGPPFREYAWFEFGNAN